MRQVYPVSQESGAEWLGHLPEHWLMTRLRFVADISTGDADTIDATEDGKYPFFVRSPRVHSIDSYCYDGEAVLLAGDGNVEDTVHHIIGRYDCHQRVYQLNRLRDVDGRYLYYYVGACFGSWIADGTAKSTVASLRLPMLQNFPLSLPPSHEQRCIATHLDAETARLDKLITKQELLIERLDEYRTALVTRTVTKGLPPEAAEAAGLDPAPTLKDSGVEWLGEVPEHWEVTRLSALAGASVDAFTDGDWVELPYITDSGVRLIQTGNVGAGQYREQGFRYIDEESFDELRCTEVRAGDVLICRLADPVGRACLAPDLGVRMITSVDVCILKPNKRNSAMYLVYMFSTKRYLSYVESLVRGGTRDRISRSMLGAIRVATPPTEEQQAIVEYLDEVTGRIDTLREKAELSVERLSEYRIALVSAAVTGKIDVRDAALAGSGGGA